jgi:hypothetical protein
MTVPVFTSPGRSGFSPQLSLSYVSGAGNGPFGFGLHPSVPSITRRTDKGLPKYLDADESDTFILSSAEDLVLVLIQKTQGWERQTFDSPASDPGYIVHRYRPRIEGLFARADFLSVYLTGWRATSASARLRQVARSVDQPTAARRYLEAMETRTTRFAELRRRGVGRDLAARTAGSPHGPWRPSNSPALTTALPNAFLASLGLASLGVAKAT